MHNNQKLGRKDNLLWVSLDKTGVVLVPQKYILYSCFFCCLILLAFKSCSPVSIFTRDKLEFLIEYEIINEVDREIRATFPHLSYRTGFWGFKIKSLHV